MIVSNLLLFWNVLLFAGYAGLSFVKKEYALYLFAVLFPFVQVKMLIVLLGLTVLTQRYSIKSSSLACRWGAPLSLAVFVFLLLHLLTALTSAHPVEAFRTILSFVLGCCIYFLLLVLVENEVQLYRFSVCLVLSAALVSVHAVCQYAAMEFIPSYWVDDSSGITRRAYAMFGNPNILSVYLVMALPIGFMLAFGSVSPVKRHLFFSIFFTISMALVLTYSRQGWLAFAAAMTVLLGLLSRRALFRIGAMAIMAVPMLPDTIFRRLSTIVSPSSDSSSSYRLQIWEAAANMIRDYGWTGVGWDPATYLKMYTHYMLPDVVVPHLHNIYLTGLVRGGVLVFFSLLYLFYSALHSGFGRVRGTGEEGGLSRYRLTQGALCSVIGFAVAGLMDETWYDLRVSTLFFGVLAVLTLSNRCREQEAR